MMGRARSVRKSARKMRTLYAWPKTQAARGDGNSLSNIEKSGRSPNSVFERILGEGARLSRRASDMYRSRWDRGALGAIGQRIRRAGPTAFSLRVFGGYCESRRPKGPAAERFPGEKRARLRGASLKCTKVGENDAPLGRMATVSGGPKRRSVD